MSGAEPFLFPCGKTGCLILHGFTGSTSDVRIMGENLAGRGYTVLGVRLAGHGTSPEDLRRTVWPDWYGSAVDGWHLLRGLCEEVFVIGFSMGGLLALKLAGEFPVRGVVSISAPIHINNKDLPLLPLLKLFRKYAPKKRKKLDETPEYVTASYTLTPLAAVSELLKLIEEVKTTLPKIAVPALVVQSQGDHTVKPGSAHYIYQSLGAADKHLLWLEKSGHMVPLEGERDLVFDAIDTFIRKVQDEGRLLSGAENL